MDPRLRVAVDASLAWYDDVFAALGIPASRHDGLWVAGGQPPRWHSAVKTLAPGVPASDVLAAMGPFPHGTVADSFGDQELDAHGFRLLIDATWLHRPGDAGSPMPDGWAVVHDPAALSAWNSAGDTDVPAHPRITVLGRYADGRLTGGVVLHDTPGAVGVSNARGAGWPEVLAVAAAVHPRRALVDYAEGDDLEAAIAAGFTPLGPQRVWVR
jgi:hypothetical protein